MCVASKTCLAHLSWVFLFTWLNQRIAEILSILGSGLTSGLCEFHGCAHCHEVWHRGLFAKSHLCCLYLRYNLELSKIHDHGWEDRNNDRFKFKHRQLCGFRNDPVLWPQSDKAHAELCLLDQSVYKSPCSAIRHYHPKVPIINSVPSLPVLRNSTEMVCEGWKLGFEPWGPIFNNGCWDIVYRLRKWYWQARVRAFYAVIAIHMFIKIQKKRFSWLFPRFTIYGFLLCDVSNYVKSAGNYSYICFITSSVILWTEKPAQVKVPLAPYRFSATTFHECGADVYWNLSLPCSVVFTCSSQRASVFMEVHEVWFKSEKWKN